MGDNSFKYRRKLAGYLLCWRIVKSLVKYISCQQYLSQPLGPLSRSAPRRQALATAKETN